MTEKGRHAAHLTLMRWWRKRGPIDPPRSSPPGWRLSGSPTAPDVFHPVGIRRLLANKRSNFPELWIMNQGGDERFGRNEQGCGLHPPGNGGNRSAGNEALKLGRCGSDHSRPRLGRSPMASPQCCPCAYEEAARLRPWEARRSRYGYPELIFGTPSSAMGTLVRAGSPSPSCV
jgi:hypothetical protein